MATNAQGQYDLGGLAAGTYRVSFFDDVGVHVGESYDNKSKLQDADNEVLAESATVNGIDAVLDERLPRIYLRHGDSFRSTTCRR